MSYALGEVVKGMEIVQLIEKQGTPSGTPKGEVKIVASGIVA